MLLPLVAPTTFVREVLSHPFIQQMPARTTIQNNPSPTSGSLYSRGKEGLSQVMSQISLGLQIVTYSPLCYNMHVFLEGKLIQE